ncbi:Histone acetyltransferase type B subunit 2 [Spironucleus salmonicida]|uniref:Histone acetyltransferase type B subunit 2 n=1 Tax=Spironucleus salmonicida TaxID=348837 RepID=V6LYF0_9EUKA|nr:Histone acetyltransferase type B subunit 2 [Spironucleus salmonicida]|eukprot:EST48736.1 Histone acetyltransferase type B subunit 2 [Spironucleus salmonicida]
MSSSETSHITATFDSFQVFKRNAHSLYDLIISHVLCFPSLTINFPPKTTLKNDQIRVPFTFSTHTDEQNFIYQQTISLPTPQTSQAQQTISVSSRGVFAGGYGNSDFGLIKPEFFAQIPAEANFSALSPDGEIIAVSVENSILIFDFHSFLINQNCAPKLTLSHIVSDCFSMVFNEFQLICGDSSGKVLIYDINSFSGEILAQCSFGASINGICVSPHFENLILFVTDQGELIFTDFKLKMLKSVLLGDVIEDFVGTSICWSCFDNNSVTIGGNEGDIIIYNIKENSARKLVKYHTGAIYQLQYSQFYDLLLAGSEDSRITLWLGGELVFVHAGHTCCVSDARFHPTIPNLIGSVAEDNSLQFWWPSNLCFEK